MWVCMKPYGMDRLMVGDADVSGCAHGGRATRVYNIKPRAYHSLRNGKKAAIRRRVKRAARREGKIACRVD